MLFLNVGKIITFLKVNHGMNALKKLFQIILLSELGEGPKPYKNHKFTQILT